MASTRPAYVAAALFTRANPLTFSRGLPRACIIMLVIISFMLVISIIIVHFFCGLFFVCFIICL